MLVNINTNQWIIIIIIQHCSEQRLLTRKQNKTKQFCYVTSEKRVVGMVISTEEISDDENLDNLHSIR